MEVRNLKQKSVGVHDFAMNPKADIPRSSFPVRQGRKTAFSAAYLVPIYLEEVYPGDMFNIGCDVVARTAVPIVPIIDNWHMEFFFFFTPTRLVFSNFTRLMGEQPDGPADSIAYTMPTVTTAAGGYPIASLGDYFGLPTVGQMNGAQTYTHQAAPMRMYNLIYNQWFRDQNLQNAVVVSTGGGPDTLAWYNLLKRGKRHDYFTACLPFVQKGPQVTMPLGTSAPVLTSATPNLVPTQANAMFMRNVTVGNASGTGYLATEVTGKVVNTSTTGTTVLGGVYPGNLYADLSAAAAATINQIRMSFQTQRLLERDARGGTRYTELIQAHFGVRPPDYRLDRPEYIGGGKVPVLVNAIPQTSATGLTGGTTPAGNLAATGYANGRVGFTYSSQEHGYIIGLANVRADLTYSQGVRRHWNRSTRYDFYFPVFAMLGEQAVLNREIFADGLTDTGTFGYIPRWDELRHFPAEITGILRPTAAGNIAYWHSSQRFTTVPTLNSTFITDDSNTVIQRNLAGGALTEGQQFICDFMFTGRVARPLPMFSVPGLVDHL